MRRMGVHHTLMRNSAETFLPADRSLPDPPKPLKSHDGYIGKNAAAEVLVVLFDRQECTLSRPTRSRTEDQPCQYH